MTPLDETLEQFRAWLDDATQAVVFTGAGISTESGIPDFRSPGGIWTRYQPIDYGDFLASEQSRRDTWERKFATHDDIKNAAPNDGHRAVAGLVANGTASVVITQNIDGLHQKSGVPDDKVIELHGNTTYARCLQCETPYDLEPILAAFQDEGTLPVCQQCGGMVKPATISFGQPMPEAAMARAQEETLNADLFLVIGSSLVVYPAAALPAMARQNGARLVILNREPTDLDPMADLVLHREIGPTLAAVCAVDAG